MVKKDLEFIFNKFPEIFFYIINNYFQEEEKILIEMIYIEKYSTTCLKKILNKNNSYISYTKYRLYEKFKDFCDLDCYFKKLLSNELFILEFDNLEKQLLFYIIKLYSKPLICQKFGIGYNRLVYVRSKILNIIKKYDTYLYEKIIKMRSKYKGLCNINVDKKYCRSFVYE